MKMMAHLSERQRKELELQQLQEQQKRLSDYTSVLQSEQGQQVYKAKEVFFDGKKQTKCGACGMFGHAASSRKCPLYRQHEEIANNDAVQVDGLRLKLKAGETGVVKPEETGTKLNVGRLKSRVKTDRAEKKRKKKETEAAAGNVYAAQYNTTSSNRKKTARLENSQRLAQVQLNAFIEEVRVLCKPPNHIASRSCHDLFCATVCRASTQALTPVLFGSMHTLFLSPRS